MQHELHAKGFGITLRPVRMSDSAFIVWLRNQDFVKGRVGNSASDVPSQEAWLGEYFERPDDYYFIIESPGGIPLGTEAIYNNPGPIAEWGRFIVQPETAAAVPGAILAFDLAFHQMGMRELLATCVSTNHTVCSLIRKFGFRQTGIAEAAQMIAGKPVDLMQYVLSAEDWTKARDRLVPVAQFAESHIREWENVQPLPAVTSL